MDSQQEEKRVSEYLKRFLPRSESSFKERLPGINELLAYLRGFKGGDRAVMGLLDLCRTFEFFGSVQNSQLDALGAIVKKCRDMREKYCQPGQTRLVFTFPELTSFVSFLGDVATASDTATWLFYYSHYVFLLISDTVMDLTDEAKRELDRAERTGKFDGKSPLQKFEEKLTWLNNTISSLPDRDSARGRDFYLREFIYTMGLDIEIPRTDSGGDGESNNDDFISLGPHCRKRVSHTADARERKIRGEHLDLASELLLSTDGLFVAEFERAIKTIQAISKVTEEIEREDKDKNFDEQTGFDEFVKRFYSSITEVTPEEREQTGSSAEEQQQQQHSASQKNSEKSERKGMMGHSTLPSRTPKGPLKIRAGKTSTNFADVIGVLENANDITQMKILLDNLGQLHPLGNVSGNFVLGIFFLTTACAIVLHPQGLVTLGNNVSRSALIFSTTVKSFFSLLKGVGRTSDVIVKKSLKNQLEKLQADRKVYVTNHAAGPLPIAYNATLRRFDQAIKDTEEQQRSSDGYYGELAKGIGGDAPGTLGTASRLWKSFTTIVLSGQSIVVMTLGAQAMSFLHAFGLETLAEGLAKNGYVNAWNGLIEALKGMIPGVILKPTGYWSQVYVLALEEFAKNTGFANFADNAWRFREMLKIYSTQEYVDMIKDIARHAEFRKVVSKKLNLPINMVKNIILDWSGIFVTPLYDIWNNFPGHTGVMTVGFLMAVTRFINGIIAWNKLTADTCVYSVAASIVGSPLFYDFLSAGGTVYPLVLSSCTLSICFVLCEQLSWRLACRTTLGSNYQTGRTRMAMITDCLMQYWGFPVSVTNFLVKSANRIVDTSPLDMLVSVGLETHSQRNGFSSKTKILLIIAKYVVGALQRVCLVCLFSSIGGLLSHLNFLNALPDIFQSLPQTGNYLLPVVAHLISNPADLIGLSMAMQFSNRVFLGFMKGTNDIKFFEPFFNTLLQGNTSAAHIDAVAKQFLSKATETDSVVALVTVGTELFLLLSPVITRLVYGNKVHFLERMPDNKLSGLDTLAFLRGLRDTTHELYSEARENFDAPKLKASSFGIEDNNENKARINSTETLWDIMIQRARPVTRVIGMIVKPTSDTHLRCFIRCYEGQGSWADATGKGEYQRRADFEDAFCQMLSTAYKHDKYTLLWGTQNVSNFFEQGDLKSNCMKNIDINLPCLADSQSSSSIKLFRVTASQNAVTLNASSPLFAILAPIKATNSEMILAYSMEF